MEALVDGTVIDHQGLLKLEASFRQEILGDLILCQLKVEADSQERFVGLKLFEGLSSCLERLVDLVAGRCLQQGKTGVPDEDATLDSHISVCEPLVSDHGPVKDLEGLDPALVVFDLNLEGVELHAGLGIDFGRWLLEEELSLGVLGPDFSPEGTLAGSCHY